MRKTNLFRKALIALAAALAITSAPLVQENVQAADPLYWPVPGHTRLSQGFHDGNAIDISDGSIAGAKVIAAHAGTVTGIWLCGSQHYGSMHDCNGFGTGLVIKGTDGRFYQYAHMRSGSIPSNVYYGAYVYAGQTIGAVGTTGNSSGNHLHFGIATGNYWNQSGINPQNENYSLGTAQQQVNLTYGAISAKSITQTNAILTSKISNPYGAKVTQVGAYFWDKNGKYIKSYSESCNLSNSTITQTLDFTKEAGLRLTAGTKYYCQFFAVAGGKTFKSGCVYFTTKPAVKITYGPMKANFIKKNNARFNAKIYNTYNTKITRCGILVWDKNKKLLRNTYINTNNSKSTATQTFDIKGCTKLTLKRNTKYYVQFYAIAAGQTFKSGCYYFYTKK